MPGSGCVRRPIHGEHHVDADGGDRAFALRIQLHPRDGSRQEARGGGCGPSGHAGARSGPSALAHPHPARLRQRDRGRGRQRGFHERGAAPPCDGPRSGRGAPPRRHRSHQQANPTPVRPQAGRPVCRRRAPSCGRHRRVDQALDRRWVRGRRCAHRHGQDAGRGMRVGQRGGGTGGGGAAFTTSARRRRARGAARVTRPGRLGGQGHTAHAHHASRSRSRLQPRGRCFRRRHGRQDQARRHRRDPLRRSARRPPSPWSRTAASQAPRRV